MMKVIDCEKTITLFEKLKKLLPTRQGILPTRYINRDQVDLIIQTLREYAIDVDIRKNE